MYFFDFDDYCASYFPVIGANAQNIFTSAPGGICDDMASTYRATRDSLYSSVSQWYQISNPASITYQFIPSQTLTWPPSTSTYTLYSGGFTSVDDGYTSSPITLPTTFYMNGTPSSNLYVGTNGYFTLGLGSGGNSTSPTPGPPSTLCGNPGDNWLSPGADLSDSTTQKQNLYYRTGYDGEGRHYVKLLVYSGIYGSTLLNQTPSSWVANFYRDTEYQWLEVMIKSTSTVRGSAGPYNASNVAQTPGTATKVWRGDLNGTNWEFMGLGTVGTPEIPPRSCPECDNYYNIFMATQNSLNFFWNDAPNNFQNIDEPTYQTFVDTVYENVRKLKNLIACVDGDKFEDFTI
jgi:hypothetical protein